MARDRERGLISQMAADGDLSAAAMEHDMAQDDDCPPVEEDGLPSLESCKPRRGMLVMIFTATHYYCGVLLGEDYEYYYLGANHAQIFSTGPYSKFYGENVATRCEEVPVVGLVKKGASVKIDHWPHKTPPKRA